MSERKWTPGPWRVVYYDAGDCDHWINCPMIDGAESADRGVVHWDGFKQRFWQSADGRQSEIDANAHLIAAAPDMYEALKEARDDIASLFVRLGMKEADSATVRKIDAALLKAEGQQ